MRLSLAESCDDTGIEAALNEIDIDHFLGGGSDYQEIVRLGLDFGFLLRKELLSSGIAGPFRVIVSARPADLELNVGSQCTVRVHRRRNGQVWLDDDLEKYREEAVAVLDF
jgi:hypothetical protein